MLIGGPSSLETTLKMVSRMADTPYEQRSLVQFLAFSRITMIFEVLGLFRNIVQASASFNIDDTVETLAVADMPN